MLVDIDGAKRFCPDTIAKYPALVAAWKSRLERNIQNTPRVDPDAAIRVRETSATSLPTTLPHPTELLTTAIETGSSNESKPLAALPSVSGRFDSDGRSLISERSTSIRQSYDERPTYSE